MLNNYFNPQSAAPDVGFKPDGFLGGALYAQRNSQYNQMQGLQEAMGQQDLAKSQAEFDTYNQDAPVRAAERNAKLGTIPSKRDSDIEENKNKAYEHVLRRLDMYEPSLKQAGRSLEGQKVYSDFLESLPQGLRAHFAPEYDPDRVLPHIAQIRDKLKNDPKHLQAMDVEGSKRETAKIIAKGNNDAAMYSADARAEATMFASLQKGVGRETAKKVESIINQYLNIIMEGKEPTPQQTKAYQAAQQIMNNYKAAGAGADPTQFKYNMINTPNGQPQPQPARPIPSPVGNPLEDRDIKGQVEAKGEPYQPNVYEYRVGPNGEIQKRKK